MGNATRGYFAITNEASTPCKRTDTADEILASMSRCCQRLSNSGHLFCNLPETNVA
jgi:hypothetical protein